jgi:tRNA-binding EMAP/Myf-like protein
MTALRKLGVFTRISPAPRVASVSCGMSLLVEEDAIEKVRRAIEETGQEYERIVKLPCQIDPRRDKYC